MVMRAFVPNALQRTARMYYYRKFIKKGKLL
jgi:hypothetical protein